MIKETLRLHSVVQFTPRATSKAAVLKGHSFPANTPFDIFFGGLHTSATYWEDPLLFNPDRWDNPIVPGSYMPFGEGPRICLGKKMALVEAKVTLMHLVIRFKISSTSEPKFQFSITYGLQPGYIIHLQPLEIHD